MAKNTDVMMQNRIFSWVLLATALILTVPLVAMQFSDEVVWTISDIVVMGMLLFGTGSLFVLTARKVSRKRRVMLGAVFTLALLYIWAELAVGVFTNIGS
jgi:hypothetical protein